MILYRWLGLVATSSLAALGLGQASFEGTYGTLSALIDTSGTVNSSTLYDVLFAHSDSDPDLYINSVQLNGGGNWDSDIDLGVDPNQFNYNFDQTYIFGTPITGDQFWQIENIASRGGSIANVDPGFYDFTIDFIGGEDANATDLVGSVEFTLEVVEDIAARASGLATPGVIMSGQETSVSMTVENLMAGRDFVSTTWYYAGGGMATALQNVGFFGDWFDKTIAPGASRTDEHTRWLATDSTPLGTHVGDMGVFGGYYYGDWHQFAMDPAPFVEVVVPEPGTVTAIVAGLALLARRRRRA